jgi:hypothetical protein
MKLSEYINMQIHDLREIIPEICRYMRNYVIVQTIELDV